jgi:hypothetical protein
MGFQLLEAHATGRSRSNARYPSSFSSKMRSSPTSNRR